MPDGKDTSRSLVSLEGYEIRWLDIVFLDYGRRLKRIDRCRSDDVNGIQVVETKYSSDFVTATGGTRIAKPGDRQFAAEHFVKSCEINGLIITGGVNCVAILIEDQEDVSGVDLIYEVVV